MKDKINSIFNNMPYNSTDLLDARDCIDQRIANYIRQVRRQKKLSIRELGEMTKIHYSYLSRIERGVKIPSDEVLDIIFKELKV